MLITLQHRSGSHQGTSLDVDVTPGHPLRFGRLPDNDVVFDPLHDLKASGRHAHIVIRDGVLVIEDLDSSNGTLLNGDLISRPMSLSPGDLIEFGPGGPSLHVAFSDDATPPAPIESVFSDAATLDDGDDPPSTLPPDPPAQPAPPLRRDRPPIETTLPEAPVFSGAGDPARQTLPERGFADLLDAARASKNDDAPAQSADEGEPRSLGRNSVVMMINTAQQQVSKRFYGLIAILVVLLIITLLILAIVVFGSKKTRQDIEQTQDALEQARAELQKARGAVEQTQTSLEQTQTSLEQTQTNLESAEGRLSQTEGRLTTTRTQLDSTRREGLKTQQALAQAERKLSQLEKDRRNTDAERRKYLERLKNDQAVETRARDHALANIRLEFSDKLRSAHARHRAEMEELKEEASVRISQRYGRAIYMLTAAPDDDRVRELIGRGPDSGQPGFAEGFCTAFAVHPSGWLATNAHCVSAIFEKRFEFARLDIPVRFYANQNGGLTPPYPLIVDTAIPHPLHTLANSPDVALIKVDLPPGESVPYVTLASSERVRQLTVGESVYILGFPGKVMNAYEVQAHFRGGNVANLTDFDQRNTDPLHSQWVWHTALTSKGTSGSPIFDRHGEVIAVNNGIFDLEEIILDNGVVQEVRHVYSAEALKFGIRVDLLHELLAIQGVALPSASP